MTEQEGVIRDSALDCKVGDIIPYMHYTSPFEVTVPDRYIQLPHQLVTWQRTVPKAKVYKFRLHPRGVIRYE